jgi:leucyl/phenylalanyl-tRNA--protein transferase
MPVYQLEEQPVFPDPSLAEPNGLLAVGGDLSIPRLINAYARGIFPWFSAGDPILWWSPDPRLVLFPDRLKVSKSLRQSIRKKDQEVRFDTRFAEVIEACSRVPRKGQQGTWITDEMKNAYVGLHEAGLAHSVEVFQQNELVGGLYGVSLGRVFFGESMFSIKQDASKVALYYLVEQLRQWEFQLIDAQVETSHMKRMGATSVPRDQFLRLLTKALKFETIKGKWYLYTQADPDNKPAPK